MIYGPPCFFFRPLCLVLIILLTLGCILLNAADPVQDWVGGWSMLDATGARLSPRFLFLPYSSSSVPYYVHGRLALKGFEMLRLEIFSETDTLLEISINDSEERTYRAVRRISGQVVNILSLKPSDFLSDPAQSYRLKPLHPEDAGTSISVYDAGTSHAFIPRRNRLVIHELSIQLPEFPVHRGILRVRNDLELKNPWMIDGDIIVEPGASLRILNTDLRIAGRIISFDGEILIDNSRLDFLQTRPGEHGIVINGKSQISVHSSQLVSVFPLDVGLSGESGLHMKETRAHGTFRYNAEDSSSILIEDCRNIGEIRYNQDAAVELHDSENVLIWLNGTSDLRETWSLPFFSRVRSWNGDGLFPVEIKNCSSVRWGLRLYKGVGGRLSRGRLQGLELVLRDGEEGDFNGVRNLKAPPSGLLGEEGYDISFGGGVKFGHWNFVAENGSSLVLRNSLFSTAEITGRNATMTIINSETSGDDGLISVSLGSSCFIQRSTVNVPLAVSFGGMVRAFDSRINGQGIVENGGFLVMRRVESGNPVQKRPGGRISGSAEAPGTFSPVAEDVILAPGLSRVEVGGIGNFLPRISGFEEYENTIVPHFEVEILRRFYVRFPEFEYVALRRGSPSFSSFSFKIAALFEREKPGEPEEEEKSDVFYLPLAFETGLRGRSRLFGPVWAAAEIAADPSTRIYSGFRFYAELSALREIPVLGVESRLYTGIQLTDPGYIEDLYYPPDMQKTGLLVEKFSYGGNISRSIGENWLVSLSCQVEDYVGPAAESPLFTGDSFDWRAILALIYRMR